MNQTSAHDRPQARENKTRASKSRDLLTLLDLLQNRSQSLHVWYLKAMKDWGEMMPLWRLRDILGRTQKSRVPWCNALSSNPSQERLGTSLIESWKMMFFCQWHRHTRIKRKIRVLPAGIEPMTFRLVLWVLILLAEEVAGVFKSNFRA